MLKEFLWETFKKTGDIEVYIAYKELEEKDLLEDVKEGIENDAQKSVAVPVTS